MTMPNSIEAEMMVGKLTPKELEIVKLITAGNTGKQLCQALGIMEGTYRHHKTAIKKKMGGRPVWGWPAVLLSAVPMERVDG